MHRRGVQSAGLGSVGGVGHSIDISQNKLDSVKRWAHAQDRYNQLSAAEDEQLYSTEQLQTQLQPHKDNKSLPKMTFLKSDTIHPSSSEPGSEPS